MPKHDLPDGPKVPSLSFEPMRIEYPPPPPTAPIPALSKALSELLEAYRTNLSVAASLWDKAGDAAETMVVDDPVGACVKKIVDALVRVTVPQPLPELDPASAALSEPGAVYLDTYRGVSINVEPYKGQWRVSFICNEIADSITSADRNLAVVTAKRRIDAILDPPVGV